MLELLFQFGLGFIIALSGALFPGPLLAFVTMKTLESGPKTGTLAASGHIVVELGILLLASLGLIALLKRPGFVQVIHLVSGIILIVFGGFTLLRSRSSTSDLENNPSTKYDPVLGGILFSTILNPTVALWWIPLGLTLLISAIENAGFMGGIF